MGNYIMFARILPLSLNICRYLDTAPLMGQSESPFLRTRELSYRNMESSQLTNSF